MWRELDRRNPKETIKSQRTTYEPGCLEKRDESRRRKPRRPRCQCANMDRDRRLSMRFDKREGREMQKEKKRRRNKDVKREEEPQTKEDGTESQNATTFLLSSSPTTSRSRFLSVMAETAPKRARVAAGDAEGGTLTSFMQWCAASGITLSPKVRMTRRSPSSLPPPSIIFRTVAVANLSRYSYLAILYKRDQKLSSHSYWNLSKSKSRTRG